MTYPSRRSALARAALDGCGMPDLPGVTRARAPWHVQVGATGSKSGRGGPAQYPQAAPQCGSGGGGGGGGGGMVYVEDGGGVSTSSRASDMAALQR